MPVMPVWLCGYTLFRYTMAGPPVASTMYSLSTAVRPNDSSPGARAVQAKQAVHALFIREQAHRRHPVEHRDALLRHGPLERLRHQARGERPAGRRPPPRVVVRLVAHILAVLVRRERHAELHELQKAARRARRLAQRDVAVHPPAAIERLGQIAHAVAVASREGELVIRLLVAARVARGAHAHTLREQHHIAHAQVPQAVRRVVAGAAAAHHHGLRRDGRQGKAAQCEFRPLHGRALTGGAGGSRRPRSAPARWRSPDRRPPPRRRRPPRPPAGRTGGSASRPPR